MNTMTKSSGLSRRKHCHCLAAAESSGYRQSSSAKWRRIILLLALLIASSTSGTTGFTPDKSLLCCPPSGGHRTRHLEVPLRWMTQNDNKQQVQLKSRSRRRKRNAKRPRGSTGLRPDARQTRWRVYGVNVHPDLLSTDSTKSTPADKLYLEPPVMQALKSRLRIREQDELLDVRVVRRSLDARKAQRPGEGPRFNYVLDVEVSGKVASQLRFRNQPGRMELLSSEAGSDNSATSKGDSNTTAASPNEAKRRVVIVGAGPAGLFCALTLARTGLVTPIILERGQPVESRGKDIGALMHRRSLDSESNFAFGEGGAGTWSDGKLTTRIGRNSGAVRFVLETLVEYGAPNTILVDGAPHLGTDNLVRLLRNMREDLRNLGGEIRFGAKMTELVIEDGVTKGVRVVYSEAIERQTSGVVSPPKYGDAETIMGDAVVLATGHSARDVYEQLHAAGVKLEAKGFAVGFRVEHPQKLINKIQYGNEWGPSVITGKSITDSANQEYFHSSENDQDGSHPGRLPVPSYRLATDKAFDGTNHRGVYSFCMCPGGQIVPASTDPGQVCVNGMSFSKRDSVWANSALVVTVSPDDEILDRYREKHGVLAGLEFQKDMERRAYELGGGNLTVPVQRLTDFIEGRASTSAPPSSYRLGVKPAACHEIYPAPLVSALRDAVVNRFSKQMPGFLSDDALLHAVETRTSSPVRVSRDAESLQALGTKGLFPSGEGAGFAGGIVSAAVDGMVVAEAVLEDVVGSDASNNRWKQKTKAVGFNY